MVLADHRTHCPTCSCSYGALREPASSHDPRLGCPAVDGCLARGAGSQATVGCLLHVAAALHSLCLVPCRLSSHQYNVNVCSAQLQLVAMRPLLRRSLFCDTHP